MSILRLWPPAIVALLLVLPAVAGTFTPGRDEGVSPRTTAHRVRRPRSSGPRGTAQRAADRVLERRVRKAIRADVFLTLAAPVVKVTSRRGLVRLVGRVRTDKEKSSIAFKAGQVARGGGIDDRVTIGDGAGGAAQGISPGASLDR